MTSERLSWKHAQAERVDVQSQKVTAVGMDHNGQVGGAQPGPRVRRQLDIHTIPRSDGVFSRRAHAIGVRPGLQAHIVPSRCNGEMYN
jgi:hypothetical protein